MTQEEIQMTRQELIELLRLDEEQKGLKRLFESNSIKMHPLIDKAKDLLMKPSDDEQAIFECEGSHYLIYIDMDGDIQIDKVRKII